MQPGSGDTSLSKKILMVLLDRSRLWRCHRIHSIPEPAGRPIGAVPAGSAAGEEDRSCRDGRCTSRHAAMLRRLSVPDSR